MRIVKLENMMVTVSTKDDLAKMMMDQPSKADFKKIEKLLLTEEGEPKFATKADMAPIIAVYQGGVFTKSFVLGAATLIGAIVGIGWGLLTLAAWLKGGTPPTS